MNYYFTYLDDGTIIGLGQTNQEDLELGDNCILCTQDQYNNSDKYKVSVSENKVIERPLNELIDDLKRDKKEEIKKAAQESYNNPVTDDKRRIWNGGVNSANSIYMASISAEITDGVTVGVYDINNQEHPLSINEAKYVAGVIMKAYNKTLSRKQYIYNTVDAMDSTDPETISKLKDVKW